MLAGKRSQHASSATAFLSGHGTCTVIMTGLTNSKFLCLLLACLTVSTKGDFEEIFCYVGVPRSLGKMPCFGVIRVGLLVLVSFFGGSEPPELRCLIFLELTFFFLELRCLIDILLLRLQINTPAHVGVIPILCDHHAMNLSASSFLYRRCCVTGCCAQSVF